MGTRSYADVPPTSTSIAMNAYIFGYGGHSLVTPHTALKQRWWTDQGIEAKVTPAFVISKLRGEEERKFLDRQLAFGEGLTDDTYMDWILERARRLFLILTEIGVPDQIFQCIDDSWDDDDLPVPWDNMKNLKLAFPNNDALNRKFYDMQFTYLLRELKQGAHIDYEANEHIPMEYVNTVPPAVALQVWDRVHFPDRPDDICMRRRYSLTDKEAKKDYREGFMKDVRRAQALQHEHIANVWASYTSKDAGFVVSDFVGEHTLGTFIDHRTPLQFMRVPAAERPVLLCEWMHCLADAVASLHYRGTAHTAIRPSNIIIDSQNHIAFADVGSLKTFQRGKKPQKSEAYDYAAPESQISKTPILLASSPPVSSVSAFSKLRKMSSSSSSTSSSASSTRSNSFSTIPASPLTPPSSGSSSFMIPPAHSVPPSSPTGSPAMGSVRNFSRRINYQARPAPIDPASPEPEPAGAMPPLAIRTKRNSASDAAEAAAEMADIYSLACVYLDIVSFMLRGKLNDFVKFRTTRVSEPNSRVKGRMDHSFHCNLDKIDAWIEILREESERRTEQIFSCVPAILLLVRSMITRNAFLRPTAVMVRDRLHGILAGQGGVETLCCAGRTWEVKTAAAAPAPAPKAASGELLRDSFSIATGTLAPYGRKDGDYTKSGNVGGDHMSVISTTSERTGSAHSATTKTSVWRRAFTRAA